VSLSRFDAEGWRDHSAARRDLANARLGLQLDNGARFTLVYNQVRISAQDPLGLTESQWRSNPRGAPLAQQYDTRKTVEQRQVGLLYEQRVAPDHDLRVMLYGGERENTQFQSIPPAAQQNPGHAGGVIDLSRSYSGVDLRWTTRQQLAGRPIEVSTGLAWDGLREQRRGYQNYIGALAAPVLGVQGRLRRDERNQVRNLDPYVQANWQIADAWSLEAGVRRSRVSFDSRDQYLSNGDDSGSARHSRVLPVAALRWQATRDLSLYASAGRGFETPTLNELSYRPDGIGGLNLGLRPALSDSLEVGAKARLAGGLLTAAVFHTRTQDEIVAHSSAGGRSSFQNAGRTRRQGAEIGWMHQSATHWRTQLAYTWLDARYVDGFCTPLPCSDANRVQADARLPGVARQSLYASVGWVPPQGWRAGVDMRAQGRVMANDRNSTSAPGYAVAGAWLGWLQTWGPWTVEAFARADNLFDRNYAGSVIVNESNGRFFEPAPGQQWSAGLSAAYRF
ncbi:MAG: TonB-dependent receptor, partial [Comamonadaceae bacterium]